MKRRTKPTEAALAADALYDAVVMKLGTNINRPGIYGDAHDSAMEAVAEAARTYRSVRFPVDHQAAEAELERWAEKSRPR